MPSRIAKLALLAMAGVGLLGCSSTGGAVPLNASARQLGPIRVAFVNANGVSGPAQIVMANGEVLNGSYANGGLTSGGLLTLPAGFVADTLDLGDGPVQIVASGPHTRIVCRGTGAIAGSGSGKCRNAAGAVWAVSW